MKTPGIGLALALLCASAPAAQAQTARPGAPAPAQAPAPPAPAPAPSEPETTTATFGDWVLRCVRQPEAGGTRVCEIVTTIQGQGQQGPLAQVAVGRVQKADPLRMTALLPANVSFPSSVRVAAEERDNQPIDLAWRRCVPGACVADAEAPNAALQRLRARTEPGRIVFKDAAGRDVVVPISFRGFAQALDALARE